MSMTARDVGKIPSGLFSWYIYLLEDGLSDAIRDDLKRNFEKFGDLIGADALAVRGYDPPSFKNEIHEAYAGVYQVIDDILPPALLVSDTAPSDLNQAEAPKVLVFQLNELAKKHGSVAGFLSELARTLADPDSIQALIDREPGKLRRCWEWLGKYVELKPGVFGCSLNVNEAIGDIVNKWDG